MASWVLALPFSVACVASAVRVVIWWATAPPADASSQDMAALLTSFWLGYMMLILSLILERRYFGLHSRRTRLWAYRLALIANAFMPMVYTLGFMKEHIITPGSPGPALAVVLAPVFVAGLLLGSVSWAIVAFLCLSKDRSSKGPGRVLPAGFAFLGSIDHWLAGVLILMFWT